MQKKISIDIETYSSTDLMKSNVYKYAEAPDFEILLIGYKIDDEAVKVLDLKKGDNTRLFLQFLLNPEYLKSSYNAPFEMACLSKFFRIQLDPKQWRCTMAEAARLGLPFGLDKCAEVLGLAAKKDYRGRALIKYFSVPCPPTTINGGRTRNLPHHSPDKWAQFIEYCRQDVAVETAIIDKISFYKVPEFEKPFFALDHQVNTRGVLIDRTFVENAIKINDQYQKRMIGEAIKITGLANPGSVAQLRAWLERETGKPVPDLRKEKIPAMIEGSHSPAVRRVLEIRQRISKSSIKKYYAMISGATADGRIRGLFQYYGANRTGRWAGRQVQVQNLIKNNLKDLDLARQLVREGDLDMLELMYGNVPLVLSQLIRTAFVAAPGKILAVSDFSAIEARVLSWLAGEQWRLDVFNGHGKIYEASAAAMFSVPIESIKKGSPLRDRGKMAELALGYQGGTAALAKMAPAGMSEDELAETVWLWRAANPKIVKFWHAVQDAAIWAVEEPGSWVECGKVAYKSQGGVLYCRLPSGRELCYQRPRIVAGKFGGSQIVFEGLVQATKQWGKLQLYGGLLAENITQAVARDLLAEKMKTLSHELVMHVHDELVLETTPGWIHEINNVMARPVAWAPGLPLAAESFETLYYKKD